MMTNFENVESIDNNSWVNNAHSFDCQELTGLNLLNLLLYTVLLYHKTVNNILLRIRGPVSQARLSFIMGLGVPLKIKLWLHHAEMVNTPYLYHYTYMSLFILIQLQLKWSLRLDRKWFALRRKPITHSWTTYRKSATYS